MKTKSLKTYQRLIRTIVQEMSTLKPGTSADRIAYLNRKFKKYKGKIESYADNKK